METRLSYYKKSVTENMMPLLHILTVILPQNTITRLNAAIPNISVLWRPC